VRVAVVGAGLAGLACAVTLERSGVETVVFEQGDKPGQAFAHVGVALPVMHRPLIDMVGELSQTYGLDLQPLTQVRRIRMYGPSVQRDITGPDLGFTVELSQAAHSAAGQLAQMYHGPLLFNTRADYFALRDTFDYVVVAGGNREIPAMLGVWQDWLRTWAVGAQVLGEFDPATVNIWLDRRFARNGYAYMIPFNEKMASLSIIVPDVRRAVAIAHWQEFLRARRISYEVVSYWDIEHVTGYVYPYQLGNTFFVGHSGGFMDAMLGFSLFVSMISGVLAGRAIVRGGSFARSVAPVRQNMLDALSLRRLFDRLENDDLDRLVATLGLPGVRDLVYHSGLNLVRAAAVSAGWYRICKAFLRPGRAFDPHGDKINRKTDWRS